MAKQEKKVVFGCITTGYFEPLSKKRQRQIKKDLIKAAAFIKLVEHDGDFVQGLNVSKT